MQEQIERESLTAHWTRSSRSIDRSPPASTELINRSCKHRTYRSILQAPNIFWPVCKFLMRRPITEHLQVTQQAEWSISCLPWVTWMFGKNSAPIIQDRPPANCCSDWVLIAGHEFKGYVVRALSIKRFDTNDHKTKIDRYQGLEKSSDTSGELRWVNEALQLQACICSSTDK